MYERNCRARSRGGLKKLHISHTPLSTRNGPDKGSLTLSGVEGHDLYGLFYKSENWLHEMGG